MYYVLLFPRGQPGWRRGLPHMRPPKEGEDKGISLREYTAFMCQVKFHLICFTIYHPAFVRRQLPATQDRKLEHSSSLLTCGRRLYQEFQLESWCRIRQQQLGFLWKAKNQKRLYNALYAGLQDAMNHNDQATARSEGRHIRLPSSVPGSPRYESRKFQNAAALARHFNKPDLFITMTTNPKWPEITRELKPDEDDYDRSDLIARVFHLKLTALLHDIKNNAIGLGPMEAMVYTIEWQKRYVPVLSTIFTGTVPT